MSPRGAGFLFGADVVQKFNHENDIELIARAHQLVMEGYKVSYRTTSAFQSLMKPGKLMIPQLMFDYQIVTVWSAPNYCYRCGNTASVVCISPSPLSGCSSHQPPPSRMSPNPHVAQKRIMDGLEQIH